MFGDRLKDLRTQAGYTQQTMLEEVIQALINTGETPAEAKVSLGTYRNWEQNIAVPNSRYLKVIAPLLNTSTDYLLGITNDVTPHDFDYSTYGLLPVTKRKIPVLGNVHCGDPVYAEEDFLDVVDSDIKADFALRAVGDSMTGAGIDEKDLVFVRRQPSVENGELAVVLINGEEAAVKRVYKYDSYISLSAENPAYAPLVFHEGDSSQVEVLGKVVAHLHYYKERK